MPTKAIIKKDLEKLKMKDTGLTGDNKVFVSHSWSPYYRALWLKSKVLLNIGKINRLKISNGTVKVRITENSTSISITHTGNFT